MHSLKYLPFPINASGETERHIKVRTGNHICMSTLTRKNANNKKKSAVKDQCLLSGHVRFFNDFPILNYELHMFKLLIK